MRFDSPFCSWVFFTKRYQSLVQIVFIDVPRSSLLERVFIPVTLELKAFVEQGLQHSVLQQSHLNQFLCVLDFNPCSVSLYDVCYKVIRFRVHLETAVEIVHYLDVFSPYLERATFLVQSQVFKKVC